jgi:diguanylate cyclase (GGDEF)-like protein/PAS domain S-box-containing protein
MAYLRRIKLVLAAVVAAFVIAATYISALVLERQRALSEVSRYNVVWPTSQATAEFARLEQRISAFASGDPTVDPDEVQLRFQIVQNRYNVLQSSDIQDFVASTKSAAATLAEFHALIERASPMVAGISKPGMARRLIELMAPMDQQLARLAALANTWDSDRVTNDQRQLLLLYWKFSGIAAGLIICGILLIIVLIGQNRWLRSAHSKLHDLTEDLKRTTLNLALANRSEQNANDELVLRNKVLIEQDRALRVQNDRFDAALNNMSQGLCMVDSAQRLIVCNRRFIELFGIDPARATTNTQMASLLGGEADHMLGRSLSQLLLLPSDAPLHDAQESRTEELPDGRTIAVSQTPMRDGGWVATYQDITERRRAEARISHMAHYDSLTNLPNRVLFHEKVERAAERLGPTGVPFAVLCLDLDRFKVINDTLGHPIGDALLKGVADRLRGCLRETDVVARLGGDEFAVLNMEARQPQAAEALAQRIVDVLSAPYSLEGNHVVIGASIGIAVARSPNQKAEQLLRNADIALYRSKAQGGSAYCFFVTEMDIELQARRRMEDDLRAGIENDQFRLVYQPILSLQKSKVSSCEALVRWEHPERGMVAPGEFIGVAEDIGIIVPLGEWVLRQACREAALWPADVKVAVNLSPVQFSDRNFLATVREALSLAGLPPSRLELEITESVLLQNNEATMVVLHQLRDLGVRIAMDDFGTGYSSLGYLRSFPFDKIKIDQSFIRELSDNADCAAIVTSVIGLAKSLGMTTTAEGIETAEQLTILRQLGCDEGQGYLLGRPQPADALARSSAEIGRRVASAA